MYRFDAHVHTCLSPCAELDMHPRAVAEAALAAGLDGIAVTDHNSAANAGAVRRAGDRAGVAVVPGMEITSREEVHVLAFLPDLTAAYELESRVQRSLPGRNDEKVFGLQVIANEDEEVIGFDEHLLSGATTLGIDAVVDCIHRSGGLAVAAHVDREGFGIVGQLGMIPEGLPLDGLELSPNAVLPEARRRFAPRGEWPLLTGSDAHQPDLVGRAVTYLLLAAPAFGELRQALAERNGRAILGGGRPMQDLALHILDVAQNGVEAGATLVEVDLVEDVASDLLAIEVRDNGRGMDEATVAQASDPFFTTRTTRRVGLGLALLRQAAEAAGGELALASRPGQGTRLRATFRLGHIDRQTVGDLETTVLVLLAGNPDVDVLFRHAACGREYVIDSRAIRAALGGGPLATPEGIQALRAALRSGEDSLAEDRQAGPGRPPRTTGGTHG